MGRRLAFRQTLRTNYSSGRQHLTRCSTGVGDAYAIRVDPPTLPRFRALGATAPSAIRSAPSGPRALRHALFQDARQACEIILSLIIRQQEQLPLMSTVRAECSPRQPPPARTSEKVGDSGKPERVYTSQGRWRHAFFPSDALSFLAGRGSVSALPSLLVEEVSQRFPPP